MKTLAKIFMIGIFNFSVIGSIALADIGIGNISVTGGGLELVGVVSASGSLEEETRAIGCVGWALIIVATLLNNKDLNINERHSETLPASKVWDAMVRQARVIAPNPSLAKDDVEIANAAKAMKIDTQSLAQMVLDIDSQAASVKPALIQTKDLETKYFPNGFESAVQRQAFNNLIALASMS